MPLSAAWSAPAPKPLSRRTAVAAGLLVVAGALGLGVAARPDLADKIGASIGQTVSHGVSGIETVAAMISERSPGERSKGALASLKHKRVTELHERALPKVRAPSPPVNPLAALVTAPPSPPIAPPAGPAPLFGLMAGPPVIVPPTGGNASGGGGGSPVFSEIPTPGGGGGAIVPPIITTAEVPPPSSAVPEPGSWALMLLGFAMTGLALRRDRLTAASTAPH
jgi:hypothetical protein